MTFMHCLDYIMITLSGLVSKQGLGTLNLLSKTIHKSMGGFLFLVLSFLLCHFPSQTSSLIPFCNHDDASALLSFKSSFTLNSSSDSSRWCESPYPKTESWENGTNCCLWEGVSCDTKSGHVIGIDLSCSCLQGEFHPNTTLFKLIHLKKLNLAFNDFSNSPMPNGFGDHVALTHLNLSHSAFSGVIPSKISQLSKLVSLDLSFLGMRIEAATLENVIVNATDIRELTLDFLNMSTIEPSSLSLLVNFSSSLVSLSLGDTGLQGKLANNILCLPNLQKLDLSVNLDLQGELPEFNRSTPLRYLDLSYTGFSGKLPNTINHLESLNYLSFESCDFGGPIPVFLSNLMQLKHLDLGGNNFSGEIPSSLSNLKHLTYLDLSVNNFGGEIPDMFDKLSKIEYLCISGNNLVGQLPSSLFGLTQLSDLDCSYNKLVGPMPDKISGLSNLCSLDLSSNSMNGTIPHWCFSLSSLIQLSLHGNQLTGSIGEFSSFSLYYCDLSYNKLQGNIPNSMFHLQNLTWLSLSSNNLTGHVDFHKFSNMQFLEILDLSDNNFLYLSFNNTEGDYNFLNLQYLYLSSCNINSFPKLLSGLKYLNSLDLSRNQIHGKIPKWFNSTGKDTLSFLDLSHNLLTSVGYLSLSWATMQYIDLSFNMLQGDIPVPPSGIEYFSVSNNKLTGRISSTICNASYLQILNLSHNNLTGKLPQCLGTFPYLSVLDLRRNMLSGMIPKTYLEIEALVTMNFNGNQLEGQLPRSVVKCKQLRVLDLGENNIQDTFPTFLESLQQLQVLVLRANRFNGTINCLKLKNVFPMLRVFDISNNNFSGNLPTACIEDFKEMMVNVHNGLEYMSGKNYTSSCYDSVVITIKGNTYELERILTTFTTMDLSNNRFGGVIPAIIGELKSLKGLNLSHNRINGVIPQNFGGLKNLEWLDLSSNMLTGEIPKALTNLHFLSVLNLSQNQLLGMIPTGKQFDTFQNDSYEGNQGLCGLPLSKSCHNDEKLPKDSATFQHDEEFRFGWKPVAIGYACGVVFGILLGYIVFFFRKTEWSISFVECILNQRRATGLMQIQDDTIKVVKGTVNQSTLGIYSRCQVDVPYSERHFS
ncbi:receptor-like protein 6 [Glycine soja]|nr:receptor-like protein 6 [Glycine soja]